MSSNPMCCRGSDPGQQESRNCCCGKSVCDGEGAVGREVSGGAEAGDN